MSSPVSHLIDESTMLNIRPVNETDQDALWDFLHIALWDPPPAPLRPRSVLDSPGVRIYAEGWGKHGDIGVLGHLAESPIPIGACWMRLLTGNVGLAYVDDETPQLGIGVLPGYQGMGYGRQLLIGAMSAAREAGVPQITLTVHPENPAEALYQALGFENIEMRHGYHLMLARL
jgi:ribosomal protein S18 acetylase RimI-like enzyme